MWTGPPTGSRAETASLLRIGDLEVLRFSGVGDFRLGRDRIEVRRADGASADLVELRLLGPVLAFWLERSGLLALHGAAVGVGGQAVVLLGSRGTGKTSLAAELVRRGHPLLSDDLAPLELREAEGERSPLRVRSGYPQLRVWPDLAARLGADPERLAPVLPGHPKRRLPVGERGFGAFCGRSLPLGGIYLLERRDDLPAGGAEVRPLPANRALVELVRHSFSPRLVAAAGLDEARLERLAVAVRSAGVRRLVYPSGFDRLGEALDALRADLG